MVLEKSFLVLAVSLLLVVGFAVEVSSVNNLIALQGNVQQDGSDLTSGNLTVVIYDSASGGSMVYNSTTDFNGAIVNGKYDIMLGAGSNELNLEYGKLYYLELFINGEQFTFDDDSTRHVFQSSVGTIDSYKFVQNIDLSNATNILASAVNKTTGTNWVGLALDSILDSIYDMIGSVNSTSNIQNLGFLNSTQLDATYLRSDGDNGTGTYNFNGGWENEGVTIAGGDVYAQTLFVYNVTSLAVNTLNVNGSIIPQIHNTFDIGSDSMRYRDLYLSGIAYVGGGSLEITPLAGASQLKFTTGEDRGRIIFINSTGVFNFAEDSSGTNYANVQVGNVTSDSGFITASSAHNQHLTLQALGSGKHVRVDDDLNVTGTAYFSGNVVNSGNATFSGHSAFGTGPTIGGGINPNYLVNIVGTHSIGHTWTSASDDVLGSRLVLLLTPTSNTNVRTRASHHYLIAQGNVNYSGDLFGMDGFVQTHTSADGYFTGDLVGVAGSVNQRGNGVITNAVGVSGRGVYISDDGGNVTNAIGFRAMEPYTPNNNGNVQNSYGLYVRNQANAQVQNSWGIYVANQSGGTTQSNGVYIGSADGYSLFVAGNSLLNNLNVTGDLYVNGVEVGAGESLWTNNSGVATYDGNVNVTGNLTVASGRTSLSLDYSEDNSGTLVNFAYPNYPYINDDFQIQMASQTNSVATDFLRFRSSSTDNLLVIWASGNVGIGTITPTQKLHVAGNANITGNLYVNGTDVSSFKSPFVATSNSIYNNTANVNFGMGVSPTAKLHIVGDNGEDIVEGEENPDAVAVLNITGGNGGADPDQFAQGGNGGGIYLASGNGGTATGSTPGSGGELYLVGGTGGVGLATNGGAGGNLHIIGGAGGGAVGGGPGDGGFVNITGGSSDSVGGNVYIDSGSGSDNGNILLGTNYGKVGIGTVSPTALLTVNGSSLLSGDLNVTGTLNLDVGERIFATSNYVVLDGDNGVLFRRAGSNIGLFSNTVFRTQGDGVQDLGATGTRWKNYYGSGNISTAGFIKGGTNGRDDTGYAVWCDGTDGDTDTGTECCAIHGYTSCKNIYLFSTGGNSCATDAGDVPFLALCYGV